MSSKGQKLGITMLLIIAVFVGIAVFGNFALTGFAAEENPNLALGKTAYASGVEVDDGSFVAARATDGSTATRWSSNTTLPTNAVWLYVDLGKASSISEIVVKWEAANSKDYNIEFSNDTSNWEIVKNIKHSTLSNENYTENIRLEKVKTARYVRLYVKSGNNYPHVGVFELEVYSKPVAPDVLKSLKNKVPTVSSDGKRIVLPSSPNSDYEIKLFGTNNPQVVDIEGNIHTPLNDTEVYLIYKAVNKNDPSIYQEGDYNVRMTIKGSYQESGSDNEKPDVLPALREWKGSTGVFKVTKNTKIVMDTNSSDSVKEKAAIIRDYIADMAGIVLTVYETSSPVSGDINLSMTGDLSELGAEGYYLEIGDILTIKAADEIGLLYGGISVTQILSNNKATLEIPRGTARDYPAYAIRSGMLDIARAWIPLEYVEEITKYFAYYKMNEIHLHINDSGENNYSAFRLESDVKGLTSTDGFYTKDEYRQYQKDVKKLGVTVITEIDTPAHSAAFKNVTPKVPMIDNHHLDITKPETLEFVKKLFDEYMTGDDPVFVDKKVHIGTDEYPGGYNEQMRAYTDALIKYANSRGYTPRFWGSFGNDGFNGVTPVSGDAQANYWATGLSDYKTLYDYGYDIINTCGPILYIVPAGNYGFADYLDISSLYKSWQVNYFSLGGGWNMPLGHPQTIGASFALWNDLHTAYGGFSQFDIFDRVKTAVALIAEKTWCGLQTKYIDPEDFVRRVELFSDKAGLTNPGRFYENGDDGYVNISSIEKSIGFPFTVEFDLTLPEPMSDEIILFDGDDGQLVANINKSGKLGFRRDVYTFAYDYKLTAGQKIHITLTGNNKETLLVIDDTFFYTPANLRAGVTRKDSSTFVLPIQTISDAVSNVKIKASAIDLNARKANNNLALGKPATVSGLEVHDGRFTPDLAVDGNDGTRLSFARDKDEQWLIIDLEKPEMVNKVEILFFEHVPEYILYVSETGNDDDWTEVYHLTGGEEGTKKLDVLEFDIIKARYIKYVQLKRHYVPAFSTYYSGGILEFRVSGFDSKKYTDIITQAEGVLDSDISFDDASALRTAIAELQSYMELETVYLSHADGLYDLLNNAILAVGEDESSSPESVNETSETNEDGNPWILMGIGIAVAAIATVAVVIAAKKKRKDNTNKS